MKGRRVPIKKLRSTGSADHSRGWSCAHAPPFRSPLLSCLLLSKPHTKLAHTAAAPTCGFRRLPSRSRGVRNTRAAHRNQVNIIIILIIVNSSKYYSSSVTRYQKQGSRVARKGYVSEDTCSVPRVSSTYVRICGVPLLRRATEKPSVS